MKQFLKEIKIPIIVFVIGAFVMIFLFRNFIEPKMKKFAKAAVEYCNRNDTLITIHNGKIDTVITIKK